MARLPGKLENTPPGGVAARLGDPPAYPHRPASAGSRKARRGESIYRNHRRGCLSRTLSFINLTADHAAAALDEIERLVHDRLAALDDLLALIQDFLAALRQPFAALLRHAGQV